MKQSYGIKREVHVHVNCFNNRDDGFKLNFVLFYAVRFFIFLIFLSIVPFLASSFFFSFFPYSRNEEGVERIRKILGRTAGCRVPIIRNADKVRYAVRAASVGA